MDTDTTTTAPAPTTGTGQLRIAPIEDILPTQRRIRWFLLGMGLVLFAQYLMWRREPLVNVAFAGWLNAQYFINLPNLDNVLLGIGSLALGAYYLARCVDAPWGVSDAFLMRPLPIRALASHLMRSWRLLLSSALLFAFLIWQLSGTYYDHFFVLVWIAALVLLLVAVARFDRANGTALAPHITRRDYLIMLAVMLLGLLICGYRLGQVPDNVIGDEGSFWETARDISTGKYQPSIFGLGVYSYPILSSFFQAWVLRLGGLSLWSWRFASVLPAILSVIPTYLLARELYDRRVAWVASLVMVAMPYFIAFARMGYNNSQSLFPVALTLYFVYAGMRRSSGLYLALGGIASGLGFYTYTAARLGFTTSIVFFVCLLLVMSVRRIRKQPQPALPSFGGASLQMLVVLVLFFAVGWFLTAYPYTRYASQQDPTSFQYKILESLFPNVTYATSLFPKEELFRDHTPIILGTQTFFYRPDLYVRLIIRGVVRSFLAFHHPTLVSDHYIKGPLPGLFGMIFYVLGMVVALKQYEQRNAALLLLWFLGGVVLLSVLNTFPPREAHLVAIIPAIAIIIAIGIVATAQFAATHIRSFSGAKNSLVLTACIGVVMIYGFYNYFVVAQSTYRADSENVMAFTAIGLESPRTIVYVYTDPARKDFVPWVIQNMPTLATYQALSRDDLVANRFALDPSTSYSFFFSEDDAPVVTSFLQNTLKKPITPSTYKNPEGGITIMFYTFDTPAT